MEELSNHLWWQNLNMTLCPCMIPTSWGGGDYMSYKSCDYILLYDKKGFYKYNQWIQMSSTKRRLSGWAWPNQVILDWALPQVREVQRMRGIWCKGDCPLHLWRWKVQCARNSEQSLSTENWEQLLADN